MADPFEVRIKFTNLLTHLSASQTSSLKCAAYALKHRDMDEDLHSCILESLETGGTNMNNRANIMYFLEHFCEMASKEGHTAYVDMVRRDVARIVEAVVGRGSRGGVSGANIKVARRVVGDLGAKAVLDTAQVSEIDHLLKAWEGERTASAAEGDDEPNPKSLPKEGKAARREGRTNGVSRVDKRAIEQRIEEDRERNKRLRESVWAVEGTDQDELDKLWEETSDLNEDDYTRAKEEAAERAQFARYHTSLLVEAGR